MRRAAMLVVVALGCGSHDEPPPPQRQAPPPALAWGTSDDDNQPFTITGARDGGNVAIDGLQLRVNLDDPTLVRQVTAGDAGGALEQFPIAAFASDRVVKLDPRRTLAITLRDGTTATAAIPPLPVRPSVLATTITKTLAAGAPVPLPPSPGASATLWLWVKPIVVGTATTLRDVKLVARYESAPPQLTAELCHGVARKRLDAATVTVRELRTGKVVAEKLVVAKPGPCGDIAYSDGGVVFSVSPLSDDDVVAYLKTVN